MRQEAGIIDCFPPRKGEDDSGKALAKKYWYLLIPIGLVLLWLAAR